MKIIMKATFNKILSISLVLIALIAFGGKAWATDFTLVKDASTLTSGDRIIIVNSDDTYAISTTQNSNNRAATSVSASQEKITPSASVQVLTLGAGTTNKSYWTLYTGSQYLYAAASSANRLKSQNNVDVNAEWEFTIQSNGNATIIASGSSNRNKMDYNANNGSPIFNCYSSAGTLHIYKEAASNFTVTVIKNQDGWGTISATSVTNVAPNTSISASSNVLTVGSTTITATPHAQDADYNYAFSSWTGIPAGGKVTADVTVTANFTRTERALTNYRTTCCTELGSINGSVNLTNEGCAAGELKATWKTSSTGLDGIASQTVKVYRADNNNEVTGLTGLTGKTAQTTNQTVTISGLTPCVEYYVKIWNVSKDGSYCESDFAGDKSSNVAAASYTITKTGVTNVTAESLSAIPATTCASGFNATIVAVSGYDLPGTITVTGANHTWNQATGALTISNVTGNVVITITPTEAQCTPLAAPSVTVSGKDYPYDAVTLSWTAVEHADGYTVEIYDGEDKIEDDNLDSGADSYTIGTTLAANKTYTYKVKATSETPATYCPSEWATDDFTTADYPSATLTLSEVGGEDYNLSGTHKLFDVVKLPSTLTYAGCTGKVLVGWSSVAIETPGSLPEENYWVAGADYTLSSTSGTLYAVYATETPGSTSWDETALSSLGAGDVFVIVGNNGSNYAMTNNNGTSNPPAASSVTVSSTHLTGTIADNIKWNISGNATDGYVFYPNGSTTTWLYCTNANNGVRVGTGDAKHFTLNNGYLYETETSDNRFVGIYTSSDWRCYTSSGVNIANQTFKYYKLNVTAAVYSNYTTACAAALANPTFSPTEDAAEEYLAAQDLTINGPKDATIYYTKTTDGNEPADPTSSSDTYSAAISMNTRATYWIKAFAKKDASESEIVEAKYNINLPFTVAEAIAEIPNEGDERAKTYIDGIVCTAGEKIDEGTMIYYISDDGTETNRICIWYGKGLDNADFTGVTDLKVGDKVRVYGLLNNFNGTTHGHYYVDDSYLTSLLSASVSSITIGGTASKTAYSSEDNTFSFAGLTATATYNTGYVKDVTSEATWKANDVTSYTVTETEDVSVTATFGGQTSDAMVVGVTYTTKTVKSIYLEYESTYTYKGMALPKPKVYAKYVEEIADEEVTSLVEAASGYDTENAYNKDVVDTYTINVAYQSKEATYTVEVRAIFNDVDHPYTPSEATTIIVDAIGENQSSDYIYVAGKVSAIDGSIDNNTLKYYISYDGTTTGQLYVYKGKYINNANFTNNNILVEGDEVVVKAKAQNYEGNLPELKSSQVMKHYRAPQFTFANIVAGDEFEYDYSPDLAVTPTQNSGDAAFTLESDDESIVSIVDGKLHAEGVGTTKITASREATNLANQMNYSAKTAEFYVTVIAKRTRYAITMDADGGTGTDPVYENQLEGATVNLPATCPYSKANHAFAAWEVNETVSGDEVTITDGHFTMPAAAVTIKATWNEVATCHISFQVNGAEVATADAPETEAYSLAGISHPNVDGFTWVGWSTTKYDNETTTLPSTITSYTPAASEATKTLYGIYSRVDINGENYGKYVKVTSAPTDWSGQYLIVYEAGNKAMDGSLASMSSSGNGIIVTIADGIVTATTTENKTLDGSSFTIAKAETNYSIRSASGKYIGCTGSSNGFNEHATTVYTNAISLENNVLSITSSGGPKLQCWVQNTSYQFRYYASSQNALALYKKDNGTTYYTSSPVEKVTITFNAKGGNGGCSTTTINKGSQLTICADVPTKSHSEFAGWNSDEEGNGDAYVAGTAYTFNASATIYAQWTDATPHAVTYVANGATGSVPTIEDQYAGDQFNIAPKGALEKDGFDFVGWTYNGTLYKAGVSFTMPAEAVEFVAQWKKQNVVKMSLITSIDQLVSGTTVVLASKDPVLNNVVKPSALAGDLGSNNYLASLTDNITFSGNEVSYTNANVLELVVEQVEGGWKLRKDATNYLKETSIKTLAWGTASEATTWTITFSNGNVNITSNLGSMKYNAQDPRFTTYASGQKDIQLYGKATVVNSSTSISEIGYVDGDVIVLNNDATLTVDANIAPTTVIVPSGSTVTVNDNKTVNANTVIVENGGTLNIADEGTVNTAETLIIHSTLGKGTGTNTSGNAPGNSGQIVNGDNITITGDVWIEIELTQESEASYGWYAFSVPFRVDAMHGVYGKPDGEDWQELQNEVGYAIMKYHGDVRAQSLYGWKKYREIMEPGTLYIIAVGKTEYKTLRFKKVANANLVSSSTVTLNKYGSETSTDAGWNGIGNPNLQISNYATGNGSPTGAYIQFLDHSANAFKNRQRNNVNLVVGSAFFFQYTGESEQTNITINKGAQAGENNGYLAPKRERNAAEETIYEVELTNVATGEQEDNIFLTAREEAQNMYEIGRDVAKMSMGDAKCAQMWVPAYGTQLCAADFQLVNDRAEYPLTINAPQAGTYSISTVANENADLYLTYEGAIIWNLSMGAYEIELTKGTTSGYGIVLQAKAPNSATGVDEVTGDKVQCTKVVIDDHVYILRGEQLYGIDGKMVK